MIKLLLQDKQESEAKYLQITQSIQMVHINDENNLQANTTATTITSVQATTNTPQPKSPTPLQDMSPSERAAAQEDFNTYRHIIQNFINQINSCQEALEKARHLRIRNGIMNLHLAEIEEYRHLDPRMAQVLKRMFPNSQNPNCQDIQSHRNQPQAQCTPAERVFSRSSMNSERPLPQAPSQVNGLHRRPPRNSSRVPTLNDNPMQGSSGDSFGFWLDPPSSSKHRPQYPLGHWQNLALHSNRGLSQSPHDTSSLRNIDSEKDDRDKELELVERSGPGKDLLYYRTRSPSPRGRSRSPRGLGEASYNGLFERQRSLSRPSRLRFRSPVTRNSPVTVAGLKAAALAGVYGESKERMEASETALPDAGKQHPAIETVEGLILHWTILTVDDM